MPTYTFTTTDFNFMNPNIRDINNANQVIGTGSGTNGLAIGFLAKNGVVETFISDPLGVGGTFANGINALGQIVGVYFDANMLSHAFLFSNNTFITIDDPLGTKGSVATDIGTTGQIVGYYTTDDGHTHGFRRSVAGNYDTIDNPSPNAVDTQLRSINDVGQIVGTYTDALNNTLHGFVRDPLQGGAFIEIIPPGTLSAVEGINNGGQITGSYTAGVGKVHGFLYDFSANTYITIDDPLGTNSNFPTGINDAGRIVGDYVQLGQGEFHGFLATVGPNPPPPAPDTTAVMILRGADNSTVRGQYQIYDLGHNAILASYQLGFVGTDWTFAGLGTFFQGDVHDILLRNVQANSLLEVYDVSRNNITAAASLGGPFPQPIGFGKFSTVGETDMLTRSDSDVGSLITVYNIRDNQIVDAANLFSVGQNWQFSGVGNFNGHGNSDLLLRDSNTGGLQIYNIANDKITGSAFLGTIGLNWEFSGVGDFTGVPGEGDLLLRNNQNGDLQIYNIHNNQLAGTALLGRVGLDWQFAGVAQVNTAGASDLILRNVNTGAFQVYNIANNQITASASLGIVGLEWQLGGFAADQPPATAGGSDGSTSQLVQAMAGFGGGSGAGESLNTAPLGSDTSQQTLLTTPHA
jgi:probable HAF family extracellular repeat protein